MRYFLIFALIFTLTGCPAAKGPVGGDSPEHLMELYKEYHASKDVDNMLRLYKTEGVSKASLKSQEKRLKRCFESEMNDISLTELTQEAIDLFNEEVRTHGQAVQYNLYIEGQLTVMYDNNRQESFLFGKENGRYFFGLYVQRML